MTPSEQFPLPIGGKSDLEFIVRSWHGNAALGSALYEAFLDQIGFVDLFHGAGIFAYRNSERTKAHRSTLEANDESFQDPLIHLVQSVPVDIKHFEAFICDRTGDKAV